MHTVMPTTVLLHAIKGHCHLTTIICVMLQCTPHPTTALVEAMVRQVNLINNWQKVQQ